MGEIAEMMLDGTMDPETGEWNFDGEDGPGWPMTGSEADEYKRQTGHSCGRHGDVNCWGEGQSRKARRRRRKRLVAASNDRAALVELLCQALTFIREEADNRSAAGSEMTDYEREPRELADRIEAVISQATGEA